MNVIVELLIVIKKRMPNRDFFLLRKLALYSDVIHLFDWKSAVEHDDDFLKA